METFHELFGSLLGFVYHCFDCIVIQGRHHRVEAYLRSAAHINVRNKRGFFSNHRDTYDRGLVLSCSETTRPWLGGLLPRQCRARRY